ncbi:MAG: hypothetical protein EZS28_000806 [Streblomastix strix]|uniref:Uncharacterized protein n=1 Tax=Streblomastix strix TaxID=222440 RepID=A0A5J4XA66_9EUKA|nr:MAG: hypothetical protein EZS28_000806 [Streblomastix strix]
MINSEIANSRAIRHLEDQLADTIQEFNIRAQDWERREFDLSSEIIRLKEKLLKRNLELDEYTIQRILQDTNIKDDQRKADERLQSTTAELEYLKSTIEDLKTENMNLKEENAQWRAALHDTQDELHRTKRLNRTSEITSKDQPYSTYSSFNNQSSNITPKYSPIHSLTKEQPLYSTASYLTKEKSYNPESPTRITQTETEISIDRSSPYNIPKYTFKQTSHQYPDKEDSIPISLSPTQYKSSSTYISPSYIHTSSTNYPSTTPSYHSITPSYHNTNTRPLLSTPTTGLSLSQRMLISSDRASRLEDELAKTELAFEKETIRNERLRDHIMVMESLNHEKKDIHSVHQHEPRSTYEYEHKYTGLPLLTPGNPPSTSYSRTYSHFTSSQARGAPS